MNKPRIVFEVEKVMGVSSDGSYQVQWAPAWVSKFHLVGCEHLIQEFLQRQQQQQQGQEEQQQQYQEPQQQHHTQEQLQQQQQHQQRQQQQLKLPQQQDQPLEIPEAFMSLKHEEDEEGDVKEPCDDTTQLHSSIPPSSTTHNNNDIHLSPYVINNDISFNTPEVDTALQQMNTITTDTTELIEVKQEDADDWSVHHPVDESCTTNSTKDYHLVSTEEVSSNVHYHNHDDEDVSTVPMLSDTTKRAEKPHICTEYGKVFAMKSNLNGHLSSTHTGSKLFSCYHCDYTCADKSTIIKHKRTHREEKPFSCDLCGKSFARIGHLKDHHLAHSGEKPYKCEHCGTLFGLKRSLTKHIRERCKVLKM